MRPPSSRPYPFFLTCFLLALLLGGAAAATETGTVQDRVVRVYDGDTLELSGLGTVRLLGIDVPEREDTERDRFFLERRISRERLRQVYTQARAFTVSAAQGRPVTLAFDGERRDRHGRLLAYVTLPDGRLLNRLLLERGYAVVYRRFGFRLKEEFLAAEAEARRRGIGLWAK